jgi:arsenate reductase
MLKFICYPKCTTCQKAEKWLVEKGVGYEKRDIKTENPTEEELNIWIEKSGLPSRKFFNTSGKLYKEMELSKKLPDMTKEEQVRLLASDGMLVKRPILVGDHGVLVGFKEADWEAALQGKQ